LGRTLPTAGEQEDDENDSPGDWHRDQADGLTEPEAPDTGFIHRLSEDFEALFGMALPHPKVDSVVDRVAPLAFGTDEFEGGQKFLIFTRRVSNRLWKILRERKACLKSWLQSKKVDDSNRQPLRARRRSVQPADRLGSEAPAGGPWTVPGLTRPMDRLGTGRFADPFGLPLPNLPTGHLDKPLRALPTGPGTTLRRSASRTSWVAPTAHSPDDDFPSHSPFFRAFGPGSGRGLRGGPHPLDQ